MGNVVEMIYLHHCGGGGLVLVIVYVNNQTIRQISFGIHSLVIIECTL